MSVREYVKAHSVAEALELLDSRERTAVVGGGAYLRLAERDLDLAVDLRSAGLDYVREIDHCVEIGAMATYRMLETDDLLRRLYGGAIAKSVRDIGGVQLRNVVTVGGTVYRRYAFSNLLTVLLAADSEVTLGRAGRMPLAEFLAGDLDHGDILVSVTVPRGNGRGAYADLTNSRNDFAVLNVAAIDAPAGLRLAVGARPGAARLAESATAWLAGHADDPDAAQKAAATAADELEFGDNLRASADYRRRICRVLTRRVLQEVLA